MSIKDVQEKGDVTPKFDVCELEGEVKFKCQTFFGCHK